MTDPHEHNEPAEHWRDCHECAKELLKRLANGMLVVDKHLFALKYDRHPQFVRRARWRSLAIARAVVNDDE